MKKKMLSVLATVILALGLSFPVASAAFAAEVHPMASTQCSQTITPAYVYWITGGKEFHKCYNGVTEITLTNVTRVASGAYPTVVRISGLGDYQVPANSTVNFNLVTITRITVG